jgi:hypothetical protein
VPTVGTAKSGANAKTALGEIQPVTHPATDPIIRFPANVVLADAALQHQVFDEATDWIVRQRSDDRGVHSKTALQAASHVVFAAAFPSAKMARGGNALIARIQAQHYFSQADQVPGALAFALNFQFCHDGGDGGDPRNLILTFSA